MVTLTGEQIEAWRVWHHGRHSSERARKEFDALCDLALRALPLPEGEGLSREEILGMWSEIESGRALPRAEDLRAVFSLALRAMPLPEGEVKDLIKRLRTNAALYSATRLEDSQCFDDAADTLSRQAAEIARKLAVINEAAEHIRAGVILRQNLIARAEAAEASLASAQKRATAFGWSARNRALEEAARIADGANAGLVPPDGGAPTPREMCANIAATIRSLSSPRQEGE